MSNPYHNFYDYIISYSKDNIYILDKCMYDLYYICEYEKHNYEYKHDWTCKDIHHVIDDLINKYSNRRYVITYKDNYIISMKARNTYTYETLCKLVHEFNLNNDGLLINVMYETNGYNPTLVFNKHNLNILNYKFSEDNKLVKIIGLDKIRKIFDFFDKYCIIN